MKKKISPTDKLLIKLETIIFTIDQTNKQFSHYYPETIFETYKVLIQKWFLYKETPTEIEINTIKLEKINVITRFYTRDVEKNLLVYYKINYPTKTCYNKIRYYYGGGGVISTTTQIHKSGVSRNKIHSYNTSVPISIFGYNDLYFTHFFTIVLESFIFSVQKNYGVCVLF